MPGTRLELTLPDASATETLGMALARSLPAEPAEQGSTVLYLYGDLGAGKTTCVRALLRALGVTGLIRSPTYTLVESYPLDGFTCIHVDLYRLQGAADVEDLGLRDHLSGHALLMIEWPERGGAALPAADAELTLDYAGESRVCRVLARSPRGSDWLHHLSRDSRLTTYVSNLT